MNTQDQTSEIINVAPCSEEDKFYVLWGRESLKHNITICNDVLRTLFTVSSALLGGSAIFLNNQVVHPNLCIPIVIFLMLTLGFSFFGIVPYSGTVAINDIAEIKQHKERALVAKLFYINCAAVFFTATVVCVLFGLLIKY